jgi:hypothetical protein
MLSAFDSSWHAAFWRYISLLYLHWFQSYNDFNAKLLKFLMYYNRLESFWLAAINVIRCNRWRHSNINGISYSDIVKVEKLVINQGYEVETLNCC